MKTIQYMCLGLSTALFLGACATSSDEGAQVYETSSRQNSQTSQTTSNRPLQDGGILPRLSGRVLERGNCGLFVWTGDQDRRFILFSQSQDGRAAWADINGEQALTITDLSGQAFQQQYTQQSFARYSKDKKVVNPTILTLSLRDIEEVVESTRFKGGTLSQITDDGTRRVIPIVALSTCR